MHVNVETKAEVTGFTVTFTPEEAGIFVLAAKYLDVYGTVNFQPEFDSRDIVLSNLGRALRETGAKQAPPLSQIKDSYLT